MSRPIIKSDGFSLIEVLVTLVLITIGVLGMVALQGKSIAFTQDTHSAIRQRCWLRTRWN